MLSKITESISSQFGASIDMLGNAIEACPDNYFQQNKRFFYLAYHTIVFLDYYLTIPPGSFDPGLPFTVLDPEQRPPDSIGDMIPDRIYTPTELLDYLSKIRQKFKQTVELLTEEQVQHQRFTEGNEEGDMDYHLLEILLYNLRHTQHHVGQLHLLMRQDLQQHLEWEFRGASE